MAEVVATARTLQPVADVAARRLGDGVVLVHLPTNRIFELNDSGARVWELLAEGRGVDAIAEALIGEYDVDRHDAAAKVQFVIEDLIQAGLIK